MNTAMNVGFFASLIVLIIVAALVLTGTDDGIVGGSALHYLFLVGFIGFSGTAPVFYITWWWSKKQTEPEGGPENTE